MFRRPHSENANHCGSPIDRIFPIENRNDNKHNNLLVLSLYRIIVIVNPGHCGGRRRKI